MIGIPTSAGSIPEMSTHWTVLSNYGHVLVALAQDSGARLRDVAERVGITERAAQRIVADLEASGVLRRYREGRRNRYEIDTSRHLRHPLEAHCQLGTLLEILQGPGRDGEPRHTTPATAVLGFSSDGDG